ncbi:MAG: DUF4407 domain-containing protein [Sphingobacteriales bacterium]|nr:MAG: DUF4407 domain-containing protein [Sphingobacteriales bacterium]
MLKFFCFLTGDQYAMVSEDTPQSKQKVVLLANTLMIPVIMWTIIGFLLSYKVLDCSLAVSIVVSIICASLIFLIERVILMSTGSQLMTRFRVTLGFVVALIGAIALDEVIFKDDIDSQLSLNKEEAVKEAKEKAGVSFDHLHHLPDAAKAITAAKKEYEQVERDIKAEVEGKGSGQRGIGKITTLYLSKADIKKDMWMQTQATYDSLLNLKEAEMLKAAAKVEKEAKSGLLTRIKAMFQLLVGNLSMGLIYLAFTVFMFCLEFIVVIVKMKTPESNYERRVKLIEQIGQRRMQMLAGVGSPLVDPGYCLPNAIAARETLNRKSHSIYN